MSTTDRARLGGETIRMVARLSQGGDALRIRVQNTFGRTPLMIDRATAGLSGPGASVSDARPVTFRGRHAVTLPPGGEIWSDDTSLPARPDTDVTISCRIAAV